MSEVAFNPATHTYRVGGVEWPSVTTVINEVLLPGRFASEEARQRGIEVHRLTTILDSEGEDATYEQAEPVYWTYLDAYKRFIYDTGFKPRLIETIVKNDDWRYCGTIDRTGVLAGADAVIDIKTGVPTASHPIQLAAYAACLSKPHRRFALYLRGNGTYKLEEFSKRTDLRLFYSAVEIWWWRKENWGMK